MMTLFDKISFIGSGNVAYNYCNVLKNNNITPSFVLTRDESKISSIEKSFAIKATADYNDIIDSDLIIIAVKDEAIRDVVLNLTTYKGVLVHTSGTQPSSILDMTPNYGVIYPLQTMTKSNIADFTRLPLLITASSSEVLKKIHTFAKMMSDNVLECTDEDRRNIHLSAVFVCNFINVMLQIGEQILEDKGFTLSLLEHLVRETIDNAFKLGPVKALTGPARRSDFDTIDKHLSLLEKDVEERKIYELLTDYIINKYKNNEEL